MVATLVVSALMLGCGDTEVVAPPGCNEMQPGMERDKCLHDEIAALPPSLAGDAMARAELIEDPMVRGAAVSEWIAEHAANIERGKGQALCDLLTGRDRSYCMRRLSSPHLQR